MADELSNGRWFTEICREGGSAFSLALGRKLHEEDSPYQRIEVYQTEAYGNLLVIDGFIMLSARENHVYHEMMSHPALFTHPDPRRVVIIGGGDCGTLREVLKHPGVERVTQVDIDERVTRVSEQFFPELCESNDDPRAELLFADGIAWMKECPAESVDLVIVDSTDPIGPAEGLFQEPFYRDCLRALTPQGLVVQQSESPLYHLESILVPLHKAVRAAGFATAATLQFFQPVYPSGWWTATMALKSGDPRAFREADARARAFDTRYYNADVHWGALALPESVRRRLAQVA